MDQTGSSLGPAAPSGRSPLAATIAAIGGGQVAVNCDLPTLGDEPSPFAVPGEVQGWAFAEAGIASVRLTVDGGPAIETRFGETRGDVSVALGAPDALRCGFVAMLGPEECPPGNHTLAVVATDTAGQTATLSGEIVVSLADARAGEGPPDPEPSLGGDGERYVPGEHPPGIVEAEHVARYAWAAGTVSGRDALDAGCGVGWGSIELARGGALTVTGVDIDGPAIASARERAGGTAEFVIGDLQALPFEAGSFDLVVSFEAIEHVEDPFRALDEFRRVLRSDGLLIVSTPNRGVYWSGNPFHIRELTAEELEHELTSRFSNVAMHRQQTYVGSIVTGDGGLRLDDPAQRLHADLLKTHGSEPGRELYTIGVASDGPLPAMRDLACFSSPADVSGFLERIAELEHQVTLAAAELSAAAQEVGELASAAAQADDKLASLHGSISWRLTAPLRAGKHAWLARRSAR